LQILSRSLSLFLKHFFYSQSTFCCLFHFYSTSEILFTSPVVSTTVPHFITFVLIRFIHAAARNKANSVAFTVPDDLLYYFIQNQLMHFRLRKCSSSTKHK
jgi:hypothetical protein